LPLGDPACVVSPPEASLPQNDSVLHGRSVWCVDDDARVRDATRALLEHWGCRVVTAGGTSDGAQLAATSPTPDLLILDYHFGQQSGPEVLRKLCERWGSSPPVILLTAERDPAVEEDARSRGWGFLHKPLRPPSLRALMKQLLVRGEVH
jgi:histidine kinase